MDKQQLVEKLQQRHKDFILFIAGLSETDFTASVNQKWTAGQQLEHIILSVRPVRQVMGLPPFLLGWVWGKCNRQPRTYDQLVQKYQSKLSAGGVASKRFLPPAVSFEQRADKTAELIKEVGQLCARTMTRNDIELDQFLIPHPLLGKLTLREMLYFTLCHVEHHEHQLKESLKKQQAS